MIGFLILTFQILIVNKVKILGAFKYILITFISFFILYQTIIFLGYDIQSCINQRLFIEDSIEETTRYRAFNTFAIFFPQNPYFGTGLHLTDEIEAEPSDFDGEKDIPISEPVEVKEAEKISMVSLRKESMVIDTEDKVEIDDSLSAIRSW